MTAQERPPVDPRILDLYNEYCHGRISRRSFVRQGCAIAGGVSAATLLDSVMPRYADAQTISFTDPRIKAEYVEYPSPRGSGRMRGYLVHPMQAPTRTTGAVLVVHENRGLNPYVEDVARRAAAQGFLALAPDGLFPVGGYPGNDDQGRILQAQLDPAKLNEDMYASARWLKFHPESNGRLGATGFCWGGGMVNRIAATLGGDFNAGVPFYGAAVPAEEAAKIRAAMMLQYAETDMGINAQRPAYEAALKAANVKYEIHTYPGTQHGFHNNSTPRYVPQQAQAAEDRMWAFFKTNLAPQA
jgi:carboxymethylenebutenolidase